MKLLKLYQYFFYKLYKSIEYTSVPKFWSEWKAIGLLILLEIWAINIVDVLFHYFTGITMSSTSGILESYQIFVIIFLVLINYYIFYYKDRWKDYIIYFEDKSKSQYRYGGIIVFGIVFLIISLYLLCLFYFMSKLKYE
ncbi:MAG: hypothetical protein PHC28_16250 [Flavobacterium sp.]|uniref:hypothetical protein n=1 Tax=Flavobacterium sp. TaxID=239 RepID=UPI0026070263|nr:hypothetical protein [Flavobacterium sp.]MDD5152005.1 hypothetical protein [Flavobacterium sp.]